MQRIESPKNEQLKEIRKLQSRKHRELTHKFLIEGPHLVEEALRANVQVEKIFLTDALYETLHEMLESVQERVVLVSDSLIKELSQTPTPQGILAVVAKKEEAFTITGEKWLLLDGIQDPGNLGTMIRTAAATGFSVIVGKNCVDLYNAKTLRSMQGSNFHLPLFEMELIEAIALLQKKGVCVLSSELNPKASVYHAYPKKEKIALVMGNEGAGVSEEVSRASDQAIYLPMTDKVESLNVAVAAGVLMYYFAFSS